MLDDPALSEARWRALERVFAAFPQTDPPTAVELFPGRSPVGEWDLDSLYIVKALASREWWSLPLGVGGELYDGLRRLPAPVWLYYFPAVLLSLLLDERGTYSLSDAMLPTDPNEIALLRTEYVQRLTEEQKLAARDVMELLYHAVLFEEAIEIPGDLEDYDVLTSLWGCRGTLSPEARRRALEDFEANNWYRR
ncbi:MAG: hypothetical protein FJ315_06935 [SAR202 cluster bacterium]|nr:hypothetical protein [SAR202 cluster bacterium]